MANPELIDKLNDILRWEWTGVAQYSQYSFVLTGIWREVFSGRFAESASESFGHAKKIGEKISALGGVPAVERDPVKQTGSLQAMLENSLCFEQTAVQLYQEALELADGVDRPLVVLLEEILLEEQEGVDEFTLILRDHESGEMADAITNVG